MAKEFKGLDVLTGEAAHPDRRKHFKVCWIIGRVVGQRDIGQGTEGNVDEGEVSLRTKRAGTQTRFDGRRVGGAQRFQMAAVRAVKACRAVSISCQAVRAIERKIRIKKPASSAIRMDCIWPKGARAQVSLGKWAARRSSG